VKGKLRRLLNLTVDERSDWFGPEFLTAGRIVSGTGCRIGRNPFCFVETLNRYHAAPNSSGEWRSMQHGKKMNFDLLNNISNLDGNLSDFTTIKA